MSWHHQPHLSLICIEFSILFFYLFIYLFFFTLRKEKRKNILYKISTFASYRDSSVPVHFGRIVYKICFWNKIKKKTTKL